MMELNLVLKADVSGSLEAFEDEIAKLPQADVEVNIVRSGVGGITESDVNLAAASDAVIIGFNVRPVGEAPSVADREGVEIRTYSVIYRAFEDLRDAMQGMLAPEEVEETVGEVEVRAIFRASRVGTIAGSYVTDGKVTRGAKVRLVRDGAVVYDGTIASLRRGPEDVREVAAGFECGIVLQNYSDIKEGDQLEVYETRQVERTPQLGDVSDEPAFVVLMRVHLHFPDVGSLKGKRAELNRVKAHLRERCGATVAEVAHQDTWQRATLAVALTAGSPGRCERGCGQRPALAGRPVSTRGAGRAACCVMGRLGVTTMTGGRMRRVDEAMREVLSGAITSELKDPRVGFVTVTAVDTTPDLRQARVYVSVLGGGAARRRSLDGLRSAHGYLQRRVGRRAAPQAHADARLRLRRHRDRAERIEELLEREAGDCGLPETPARGTG